MKGSEIANNPQKVWQLDIAYGDVIQTAPSVLGFLGSAEHTMYIHSVSLSEQELLLAYHSKSTINKKLTDVARDNPDTYFIFYTM